MPVRQRYREGDWFAVPLDDGRYVLGRISRHSHGIIFGYFFAPPFDHVPTLEEAGGRTADDSFLQLRFGHLGLRDGEWPALGQTGDWDRDAWPLLEFENRLSVKGRPDVLYAVRLDEDTVARMVSRRKIDLSEAGRRPDEALFGHLAVVTHLQRCLGSAS
jgi:hypothetical protein